jgi:hypothetical protein
MKVLICDWCAKPKDDLLDVQTLDVPSRRYRSICSKCVELKRLKVNPESKCDRCKRYKLQLYKTSFQGVLYEFVCMPCVLEIRQRPNRTP